MQCSLTPTYRNITIQVLKSGPICWEISLTLEINHFIFEVGSRKSEVGSRKSEVGNQKSEVGSPSSAFVLRTFLRQLRHLNFTPLIVLLNDSSKILHLGQCLEFSRQQTLSRLVGIVTRFPQMHLHIVWNNENKANTKPLAIAKHCYQCVFQTSVVSFHWRISHYINNLLQKEDRDAKENFTYLLTNILFKNRPSLYLKGSPICLP